LFSFFCFVAEADYARFKLIISKQTHSAVELTKYIADKKNKAVYSENGFSSPFPNCCSITICYYSLYYVHLFRIQSCRCNTCNNCEL